MLKKLNKWILIFIVQVLVWFIMIKNEKSSIFWYNVFTIKFNHIVSKFSSIIDFPIGEIFYVLCGILIFYFIYKLYRYKTYNHFLIFINIIIFLYQSCWGIVYHVNKIDIENSKLKLKDIELKDLYCRYIIQANTIRDGINNNYNETLKLAVSRDEILNEFINNSQKINDLKWIKNFNSIETPEFKISKFSTLMSYSGILGYYNPFTIESNINITNTDLKRINTIYHELAHQMGFASENEANFIAFLIGNDSKHPEIRYAVYFKSLLSILNNISKTDPLFVKVQIEDMPKLIKQDYDREIEYYKKYEGKFNEFFSKLNNIFLKANNQEGTISYSKYIILVNYYEKNRADKQL